MNTTLKSALATAERTYPDLPSFLRAQDPVSRVPWRDWSADGQLDLMLAPGSGSLYMRPTLWALSQLCRRLGYDGTTIARLRPALASRALNEATPRARGGQAVVRNFTMTGLVSDRYRVYTNRDWAADLVQPCLQAGMVLPVRHDPDGRPATWEEASNRLGVRQGDLVRPVGLFENERAACCFLLSPERIEWNGRTMAPFVMTSNSEVGSQSVWLWTGVLDFVCANFYLWGARTTFESRVAHVGAMRGLDAMRDEVLGVCERVSDAGWARRFQTRLDLLAAAPAPQEDRRRLKNPEATRWDVLEARTRRSQGLDIDRRIVRDARTAQAVGL